MKASLRFVGVFLVVLALVSSLVWWNKKDLVPSSPPQQKVGQTVARPTTPNIGDWRALYRLPPDMRLKWLVQHHPDPLVYDKLNSWISTSVISWTIHQATGAIASFSMVSAQGYSELVPTLVIGPSIMQDPTSKTTVLGWMLVLYHEAIHVQQWLKDPHDSSFKVATSGEPRSPDECARVLNNETAAYLAECQLAAHWDMQMSLDCSNHAALKKSYVAAVKTAMPQLDELCGSTFTSLIQP